MKFSLVLATLGRYAEVEKLLASLRQQTFPADEFEVLVLDQNQELDLAPLVAQSGLANLCHVKLSRKGLSYARNQGLALAQGEWVAFPDDDCTFYPDTLQCVAGLIAGQADVGLWMGRIWDRAAGQDVIRSWPRQECRIFQKNFYHLSSSITLFAKKSDLRFDEDLGVGGRFGANEDTDYILRHLKQGVVAQYHPCIELWHPQPGQVSPAKAYGYGEGFGALARKHGLYGLFVQALLFHLVKGLLAAVTFRKPEMLLRLRAFQGRIKGWMAFGAGH